MSIATYRMVLLIVIMAAASANGDITLENTFRQVDKTTAWKPAETVKIGFRTFHPQGLTAVGDRFFLSSVEVVDRAAGQGIGHLFEMDREGNLLREITLGEGEMYHPGGIDYDGTKIWVSVAAYRPDSLSIVYTVDPDTLQRREVFRFHDHLGAVSHFPDKNLLVAVSWGSRRFYRWETALQEGKWTAPNPEHPVMKPNGNHYIDYQDMQRIPGTLYLLCSGFQTYSQQGDRFPSLRLGGIDLVHVEELCAQHQVPVPVRPPAMPVWTQNPFYVESMNNGVRFFFIPEDNTSTLHVFEVETVK
ncbi:MAG TPA: DUF6454 family protein [Candidatus Hydrogenedentes bacterium]|nr:DUF6454 family protein [Candidatus Hydrogenedentota bacterium]